MPAASAMVSIRAAKSLARYALGSACRVAAPKCACSISRVAAVTGIGTSISRPSARPRSRSLRNSSGVKVVAQSRLTRAGDLYAVNIEPMTLLLRNARKAWRGTRAPPRFPGIPQQQRHGLDVHRIQVAGPGQSRLGDDLHARAVAQGPRPRSRAWARNGRADAGDRRNAGN